MNAIDPAALGDLWRSAWTQGFLAFALWVAGLLLLHHVLMRALRRIAARTAWTWDDVLIGALRWPSTIAILASGLVLMGRILPLDAEWDRAFDVLLAGAIVLALILFVDRSTSGLLDRLAVQHAVLQGARGLVQGAVRGVIIGIGLLIFVDSIGISIAPILASLGVGSLAVALALQETLANLFAGFHLIADKPIEAGHFVRLQGGEEGHVVRVGWRSTWITTLQNNMVVVPNSKLSGAVLTNFDLPSSESLFTVDVLVAHGSDLDEVERIATEAARETLSTTEGASAGHEPVVRFTGYGDSGIRLTVGLAAASLRDSHGVRHDFVKRVTGRFRRAGIVIPFPTRTIDAPRGLFGGPPAGGGGTGGGADARGATGALGEAGR
jgi:small-conductance mechanosensitive channel